jgi:protein TonB
MSVQVAMPGQTTVGRSTTLPKLIERERRRHRRRLVIWSTLGLLLVLLGIGKFAPVAQKASRALVIDLMPESQRAEAPARTETAHESAKQAEHKQQLKPPPIVLPAKPTIAAPQPDKSPSFIEMSHDELAAADISNLPKAGAGEGDSEVVGHGPNGEVLYAAEWAREPTDQELAFYLPRDAPEGYGLIACKTYPQNRVDDCIALESNPASSHLARAVLNAAWQFKVRPPRRNGKPMIGEWVEIKIDYIGRSAD